ncbi:MAG: glutaredoxin [Calditrichaeota bacterium]|nr:MAG: glutaredoxin [Calditrichota bacterium]
MAFLKEQDRIEIRKRLEGLQNPVKLVFFTQELECMYCKETHQLLQELAELSDKLTLEVYNFAIDREMAEKFSIDKIPATVVMGEKDYGIRFYGIPSGFEFSTLLEDILMVSRGDSGLSEETRKALKAITTPVHLQVFVTPTCPYCPQAVYLAHQFAFESDQITADMVEATEFPHLAQKYRVMGVPKTVANDRDVVEGAAPEPMLLERLQEVLKAEIANS